MPRIDPLTGCKVLTLPEFFQAEAEREGKQPHEIMQEVFDCLDDDNRHIENDMRNPVKALKILQSYSKDQLEAWHSDKRFYERQGHVFNDPLPYTPAEVLSVEKAESHQTFSKSRSALTATVRCTDGIIRKAVYSSYCFNGSRMEPPEGEENVDWSKI